MSEKYLLLTGEDVHHKSYGSGVIIAIRNGYVEIDFSSIGLKLFQFPQALRQHLTLTRPEAIKLSQEILDAYDHEQNEKQARLDILRRRTEPDLREELIQRMQKQRAEQEAEAQADAKNARKKRQLSGSLPLIAFTCSLVDELSDPEQKMNELRFDDLQRLDAQEDNLLRDPERFASPMLQNRVAYSGFYKSGKRQGEGVRVSKIAEGAWVLLTFVPKDAREREREIIACYQIERFHHGDDRHSAYVKASNDPKAFIVFPKKHREHLHFWDFLPHEVESKAQLRLGSGTYRYLEPEEFTPILERMLELVEDEDQKSQLQGLADAIEEQKEATNA